MRPDLPWSVAGIPPEAREAARAAARREGLTLGEWLTRRIIARFAEPSSADDHAQPAESFAPQEAAIPEHHDQPAQAFAATSHLEAELRAFMRRIEAAERLQTENLRAISRAASEMTEATRERKQVADQFGSNLGAVSERLDRLEQSVSAGVQRLEKVERNAQGENLREAIRVLHQGLSRLSEQASEGASRTATQIAGVSDQLESLSGRLRQVRSESEAQLRALENRHAQFEERLRGQEKLFDQNARDTARLAAASAAIARLEEGLARLEARPVTDPSVERRLAGTERRIQDLQARPEPPPVIDRTLDARLEALGKRLEAKEREQEALAEELKALKLVKAPVDAGPSPAEEHALAPAVDPAPAPELPATAFAETAREEAHEPPPEPGFSAEGALPENAPRRLDDQAFVPASMLPTLELNDAIPPEVAESETPAPAAPPTMESFLAAARRSAQVAAAEAEASAAKSGIGFGWGREAPRDDEEPRRLRLVFGAVAAIVILALAVIAFGQRQVLFPALWPAGTGQSAGAERHIVFHPSSRLAAPALSAPSPAALPKTAAATDRVALLAAKGDARAETVLGLRYLDGAGVTRNDTTGAQWLERAAGHGEPVAQYRLATLYESGKGLKADRAQAVRWYQAAAAAGNCKAMHNLAVAYAQGSGVTKDLPEAARWFSKAAALGLADSEFNLAVLYERGEGVPQSLLDAYKWYTIAAQQGDGESKIRASAIAAELSADDRAAAERSAAEFKPKTPDLRANVPPSPVSLAG